MSTWIRCGNTRFTVHESAGLTPGQTYSFRVIAENIYGKSAPSEESSPVTIRETTKKKVQKRTYEGQSRGYIFDSLKVSLKFYYRNGGRGRKNSEIRWETERSSLLYLYLKKH